MRALGLNLARPKPSRARVTPFPKRASLVKTEVRRRILMQLLFGIIKTKQ